jgi:hypothetical protein
VILTYFPAIDFDINLVLFLKVEVDLILSNDVENVGGNPFKNVVHG